MSCYFRYMKDIFKEAGVVITAHNKKHVDEAIHRIVNVKYKKCMPDCWGEVKERIGHGERRQRFIAQLEKALKA